mgnify:CR=1 FL=1
MKNRTLQRLCIGWLAYWTIGAAFPVAAQNTAKIEGAIQNTANTSSAARDSVRRARRESMARMHGTSYYFYDSPLQVSVPALDSTKHPLSQFQIYDKVYAHQDFRNGRGEVGQTDQVLGYKPRLATGYEERYNPFSSWMYTIENTRFYQTKIPYSNLYYVNNFGKNLHVFNVTHSQNVYRGLNLTVDYNVLQSQGVYVNSNTLQHNLRFYGNFFTRDARYRLQFGYIRNTARVGENGGIIDDSLFTENLTSNRLSIPIRFSEGTNSRWRDNTYFLKQVYHIYVDRKDTLPENDRSYGFIAHTFEVHDYRRTYVDRTTAANGYYTDFWVNETQSRDTSWDMQLTQRLYYSYGDVDQLDGRFLKLAAGGKFTYVQQRDMLYRQQWHSWYPFAELQGVIARRVVLDAYADFGAGGYNQGDYLARFYAKYCFKDGGLNLLRNDGVKLFVGYTRHAPEFMKSYHFSNHFYWRHDWRKEAELFAGLEFSYKGWWLKAYGARKTDYVFYKQDGPVQADKAFCVGNVTVGKDLEIGKYIGLNSLLMFAYVSDENYMHLPLFSMRESLYGRIPIKNLAEIQVGVDFFYNTAYHADAYMPAWNAYYWQDEVETGNSLLMDLYVNFRIKRMNVFLKLQNVAQGLLPYNYFETPHYPLHDRCFRFGLAWRFFD